MVYWIAINCDFMPKYKDYKQGAQQSLFPLDLSTIIPQNHLVRHIDSVIDRLDQKVYESVFSNKGASAYHPQMMLKIIIYAYSVKVYSCRKIAAMLRQDVTFMWLSGMQTPDFNTINRFRSNYLKDVLEPAFSEVLVFLHEHEFIKFENYFVDGTKLEADAGKYTHVWRKNTERYKKAVCDRIGVLFNEIEELNQGENKLFDNKDLPEIGESSDVKSTDIDNVVEKINENIDQSTKKSTNKRKLAGRVTKLKKENEKLRKYEGQEEVLGDRNSYSKTDHDATMMRMKGSEELRPGYNPQVSSENQFIVNVTVGQSASDTACFNDHFKQILNRGEQFTPTNYIGDAAYGSCENYDLLEKNSINSYLKFSTYHREKTKKFKANIFHPDNLKYNSEKDYYICPSGNHIVFKRFSDRKRASGYINKEKVYECEDCSSCSVKEKCTKATGNRTIRITPKLEEHKKVARANLNSDLGKDLRKRRGWEIETFFGDLKHNQNYTRIRLRGLIKANMEMLWLAISYNLRKSCIIQA